MNKNILVAGLFACALPVCSAMAIPIPAVQPANVPPVVPPPSTREVVGETRGEKYTKAYDACYEEAESKTNSAGDDAWSDFFNQCMKNKGFTPDPTDESVDGEEGTIQ